MTFWALALVYGKKVLFVIILFLFSQPTATWEALRFGNVCVRMWYTTLECLILWHMEKCVATGKNSNLWMTFSSSMLNTPIPLFCIFQHK